MEEAVPYTMMPVELLEQSIPFSNWIGILILLPLEDWIYEKSHCGL
jgi:hypothetical protein